jgi:hypothetical protein
MKMEQCVPKRWLIKFRHRGVTRRKEYNYFMFVILVFIYKDIVFMLYLVLSTSVQLEADSADRIYDYSLYYSM